MQRAAPADGTSRLWLGGILLVALLLRGGWALSRPASDAALASLPDQVEYLALARNLLHGQGLSFVDPRFGERVFAFRMPGYPLFVAACGGNVRAVRTVQVVLDVSTVLAAYVMARLLMVNGGRRVALAAAALVASNPLLIYFCGLVLSETLFTATLAWGMVLLLAGHAVRGRAARAGLWLAGAALLAAAVPVRPSAAGLPLVLGIAAAFANLRRGAAYQPPWPLAVGLTMILLVTLALVPWALRNQRVLHAALWTDTNSGFTLYDGYNPDATGASDQRFVRYLRQLRSMNEVARSQYLTGLAREYALAHPRRVGELALAKAGRTWSPVPLSDQFGKPLYRLVGGGYAVLFDLLVLWALWDGHLRKSAKVFLLAPAIYLTAVHALTIGSLRYRLPAEVPMAVLAASILHSAPSPWKRAGLREAEE